MEELLMLGKMEDRSSGPRVEGPDEKPGTAEVIGVTGPPVGPKSAEELLLLVVLLLLVLMEEAASAEMGTVVLAKLGR